MAAGFDDLKNQLSSNLVSRDFQTPYLGKGERRRSETNEDEDFLTSQLLNDDPVSPEKEEQSRKKNSDKKAVGPVVPIMEDEDEDQVSPMKEENENLTSA